MRARHAQNAARPRRLPFALSKRSTTNPASTSCCSKWPRRGCSRHGCRAPCCQYFNFGKAEVQSATAQGMAFAFDDLPIDLVPWFDAMFTGFIETVVGQCGGKSPAVALREVKELGVDGHGAQLGGMSVDVSWA